MELPTWSALTRAQRKALDTPLNESVFIAGPPGSGKTVLAIRRAQAVQDSGKRVLLLTYNRMLRRAAELLDNTNQVQVATMHSYCWRDYRSRTGEPPPGSEGSFDWEWSKMLNTLRRHPARAQTHDHLVIDEAQDLPPRFFKYARLHIAPSMSVFADENQIVGEYSSTLEEIKTWGRLGDAELLGDNHRNTPEIVAVANHFYAGRLPVPRIHRPSQDDLPRVVQHRRMENTAELIARWYRTYAGSIGVVVRQVATGRRLYNLLGQQGLRARVDFYTNDQENEDSIEVFAPGITILTDGAVKGQEFHTLFLLELERFIPCPGEAHRRIMYMICSRPRDHLIMVYGPGRLAPAALAALPGLALLERP